MKRKMRRVFSLILAATMFLCAYAGAAAETAVYKTTQQFIDYLEAEGVKYKYAGIDGSSECIQVTYRLDNFSSAQCSIFFKDDCEEVSLRIWNIITASAGKNYVLSTLNSLNKAYKFGKFVFDDSDSTVQIEMDMYIDPDHCDRSVYDALQVLFQIVDEDEIAEKLHSLE